MEISRQLKQKINRLSHHAGHAYGEQMKARLTDEVERRITAGESFAAISAYLGIGEQPQCAVGCDGVHNLPTMAEAFGNLPVIDTSVLIDGAGLLAAIR